MNQQSQRAALGRRDACTTRSVVRAFAAIGAEAGTDGGEAGGEFALEAAVDGAVVLAVDAEIILGGDGVGGVLVARAAAIELCGGPC